MGKDDELMTAYKMDFYPVFSIDVSLSSDSLTTTRGDSQNGIV